MIKLLVIDDLRSPLPKTAALYDEVQVARTSEEGIKALSAPGGWHTVMFDHDLGINPETGEEDSIRSVIRFMEQEAAAGRRIPIEQALAHSDNPIGKRWTMQSLNSMGYLVGSVASTQWLVAGEG